MSRLLVLLVLLSAMALSGTADASLRAVGPAGHVVICANGAAVTVAVGADGLPVEPGDPAAPGLHCPECLPLVMAAAGGTPSCATARPHAHSAATVPPAAFPPRTSSHEAIPSPRGPPGGDDA